DAAVELMGCGGRGDGDAAMGAGDAGGFGPMAGHHTSENAPFAARGGGERLEVLGQGIFPEGVMGGAKDFGVVAVHALVTAGRGESPAHMVDALKGVVGGGLYVGVAESLVGDA